MTAVEGESEFCGPSFVVWSPVILIAIVAGCVSFAVSMRENARIVASERDAWQMRRKCVRLDLLSGGLPCCDFLTVSRSLFVTSVLELWKDPDVLGCAFVKGDGESLRRQHN
jgi:hypothetical protein